MVEKSGFLGWILKKRNGWIALLLVGAGVFLLILPTVDFRGEDVSEEDRIEALCSNVDGVGECRVLLSCDEGGAVVSALVICEGGDKTEIRHRLTELLSSFYGIGYNRITVEKMN